MWKTSMTYEKCSPGTSYESANNQDIKVQTVWDFISCLFTENITQEGITIPEKQATCNRHSFPKRSISFTTDKLEHSYTKFWLQQRGTKHIIIHPILNDKQNQIGYVGVEYCEANKHVHTIGCEICKVATDLSYLLNKK
jgi:hypothetical protein